MDLWPQLGRALARVRRFVGVDGLARWGDLGASRAEALDRVDVSIQNAAAESRFDRVVSQAVSASQFADPDFERLRGLLFPDVPISAPHRKVWEFCYVLKAAEQYGRLRPGSRALGFGVGREPIPAVLAGLGLTVLATDLSPGAPHSAGWGADGQHMSDLGALANPAVVSDEVLARQVRTRFVDMTAIPDDLGRFDLVWSSSAFEHLGSPRAGLDFVLATLDLLEPGGVSVHTTELELTLRTETADYGHLVVYRTADLDGLAAEIRARGFEIRTNWHVSMDTPADRWIALPPYPHDDPAHLKVLVGGGSVATSVGLLIRRP